MHSWTVLCVLLVVGTCGLVKAAPSAPILINYYDEKSETRARPVRTPLRIVAEPLKSKGSITYFNNEVDQEVNTVPQGVPQRLTPVTPLRQYFNQKVPRIQPVPAQYPGSGVQETDPIKLSLAASPLRLIPVPSQKLANVEPQKKYFGASDYVDEYVEPISVKAPVSERTTVNLAPSVQYTYKTAYGDSEWSKKSKVPAKKTAAISKSAYKIDGLDDRKLTIDKLAKLDKYRLKSEEDSSEESNSDSNSSSSSSSEEDGSSSSSSEEDSSEENEGAKKNSDEEDNSNTQQLNYPTNYYSQVRDSTLIKHQPAPLNDLRVTEKINTKKTGIVYSEQGHNDKSYDHGRFKKLYEVRHRYRRDLENHENKQEYEAHIEILPIPLALEKVKEVSQLNGDELLTYIQNLINNSSKYLTNTTLKDDDYDIVSSLLLNPAELKRQFALPNVTESQSEAPEIKSHPEKHPFLNIPDSALRFAESIDHLRTGDSYYNSKNGPLCVEATPNLRGKRYKKKKNVDLGRKIDCLKKRYFGENPLDNPLFAEESIKENGVNVSAFDISRQINSKLVRSLDHALNPSINVYDDVISNIRSAIVAEHANVKDRNQREILKLKTKALDTESSESNINQNVSVVPPLPKTYVNDGIFDISKYLPKTYYDPKDGVIYAVRLNKKKKRRNSVKAHNYHHKPQHKDNTIFPALEPENPRKSFFEDQKFHHSNNKLRKRQHRPRYPTPSLSPHAPHTILSSGYYPYPILAGRKKRFHYELLRKAH